VKAKDKFKAIPLFLTVLRMVLGPAIAVIAIYRPSSLAFAACLIAAFLSDVFDGIIARHLGVATPNLRRLDSVADTMFYLGAAFAAWHLYPHAITDRFIPLALLGGLEISRYLLDLWKFGKEASYHMWSSKLWGIALFVGFFSLLALGFDGLPMSLAIFFGLIADLEGLAISLVIREWKTDVPSLYHALMVNRKARI
jgi:CDP-diacylglycerol--glycerol-3-phosphate 3-phosphatidyltransferase